MKKRQFVFIVFLVLLLSWAFVIFGFSSNNAEESLEQSDGITKWLLMLFDDEFEDLPEEQQLEMIEEYDWIVRKFAHFASFAVLCVLAYYCAGSLKHLPDRYIRPALISVPFCVVFAISDEFHQTFVDGRAGRFTDVLIDSAGVLTGTAVATALLLLARKMNKKKKDA